SDRDDGRQPGTVDQSLVRCQPLRAGQAKTAVVALQRLPLLDRALPEGLLADELSPSRVLERPRHDLAGRRAALVDEHDDLDGGIRGDASRLGVRWDGIRLRALLPEDRSRGDELAGDAPGGGDVAAGIAPEVDDDLPLAGIDVPFEGGLEVAGGLVAEAGDLQVAHGPRCEVLRDDLLLDDDVARDLHVEWGGRPAHDRQGHDGSLRASNAADSSV